MRQPHDNFLGLDEQDYETAKVVLLPVPYEGTVSYGKGTAKGPQAIIDASKYIELYDDELDRECHAIGIGTLPNLKAEETPQQMHEAIYNRSKQLLADGKFVVMLGGEHSISSGLARAYKEKYNDLSVLQIDAHTDLRDEYEGSRYSHASVMARIIEFAPLTQVGIRSMDITEKKYREDERTKIFFARDLMTNNTWMEDVVQRLSEHVFITIDVDGLDPSIMSATGTPEPGGLSWYQVINLFKKVAKNKTIVGFDIVELAPNEHSRACDFTAAKLVYKLLNYTFFKDKLQ